MSITSPVETELSVRERSIELPNWFLTFSSDPKQVKRPPSFKIATFEQTLYASSIW